MTIEKYNNEMNTDRKQLLINIMEWFWTDAYAADIISLSDYEFVFDIWKNGLNFYGYNVQTRLNDIRDKYSDSMKPQTRHELTNQIIKHNKSWQHDFKDK